MFVLKSRNGTLFYLENSQEFTVGRKNCNLLLSDDQSISRLHAKLFLRNKKLVLVDTGSRYGTFVNSEKLTPNIEIELKESNEIRFGQLQSYYRVEQITIVTTTSTIKGDAKKNLLNNMNLLGGSLQSNWTAHCTHLTVEEILLTVKVLCAIIKGIPIVTLKYWDDYVANVKKNLPPPNVQDYKPVCSEVTLGKDVELDFMPGRLQLFKDKLFVFPTKNDKAKMVDLIRLAGGDAISWDASPFIPKDLVNPEREYIILEMGTTLSENIEPPLLAIIKYNAEHGKRTVPIQEIALAIINCSCEKDCNPSFDRKGTVLALKTQILHTQHTENVLVMTTQTQSSGDEFKSEVLVPQTNEMEILDHKVPEIKLEDTTIASDTTKEVEQATTIKRENETSTSLLTAHKRIKLDMDGNAVGKCVEPFGNVVPGKGKFTFRGDKDNKNEQSKQESLNPFAMKRKTRESDDVDIPSKRSVAVEGGDTSLSKPQNIINPFSLMMAKKKSARTSNNTATSSFPMSDQNTDSSNSVNDGIPSSIHLDISAIVPVSSQMEKSCCWLSKTRCISKSITNKSIAAHSGSAEEMDDDLIKYIESFRNLVVVEHEPLTTRRTSHTSNSCHDLSLHNGQNFKKFKKVQPLKIQATIIPESSYVRIICNQRGAIQVMQEGSDEDDDIRVAIRA